LPIYEYRCEECGHTFEVIQKFSDLPLRECVVCSGPVHRILSPPGLLFKGNGWYITDYPTPERKRAIEAEKSPKPSSNDGAQAEAISP